MYIFLVNIYCFGKQNRCFCYKTTEEVQNNAETLECLKQKYLGSIVEVDFAKKITTGIILSCNICKIENNCININGKNIELTKIKPISKVLYQNFLTEQFLQFLSNMAFYYAIEMEKLIQLVIPSFWIKKKKDVIIRQKAKQNKSTETSILSSEQQQISMQLFAEKNKFGVSVLRGVMGSGKTYVFLDVVKKILMEDDNAQALIMVPEIALTEQLMDKIYQICGLEAIIWHSSISNAKKKQYYEMIIGGKVKIIVSTRSGVLLPYKNLKIIVIDEEHDNSYKQDEVPSYQARDMAILRGKYENFQIILTSATPSIETINNVLLKKYKIFNLNSQFFNIKPPEILLIDNDFGKKNAEEKNTTDSKKETYNLSQIARQALIETKQKKEQSLVFINRRGYSRTLKCNSCGYEIKCKNCDNLLSYHKKNNTLKCHYCGFKIQNYSTCESCGGKELLPNGGIGVEQIQKEIENFLQCNTVIFSSDEINKDTDITKLTNEIKNGNIDIIIGTQIITKGHHFPNLTTIIVLDIDGIALSGDFRAYEKMFQMLFQLSGRAGREKQGAKIYIQTNNKNNIVLQKLQQHDLEGFYKQELLQRKQFFLPPFSRFISIIVASQDKTKANTVAEKIKKKLLENKSNVNSDIKILGPTESQLHFLKKSYRYRFLIVSKKTQDIFIYLNKTNLIEFNSRNVQVKIDVDPYSFL